ncbi:MAG: glycosyltransferase family 4 protein [Candidatus Peribacteraceae bacterium]|nr:glycosyltransferase family 4 protein [Candidatus Peribacteraceae bacterium]
MLPWAEYIKNMDVESVTLMASIFPPFPEDEIDLSGGSEIASDIFVKELMEQGIHVDVISLDYIKPVSTSQRYITRIDNYYPYLLMDPKSSQVIFAYKELFRPLIFLKIISHLIKNKPDIVIIGKTYQFSLAPMIAARFLRIPYIMRYDWLCPTNPKPELCTLKDRFHCADCIQQITGKSIPKVGKIFAGFYFVPMAILKRFLWNQAEKVLAVSPFHKLLIKSFGIREDIITILPNIVPVKSNEKNVEKLKRKYDTDGFVTLLYVGRLEPEKGIEILIDAFNQVRPRQKIKLLIAGAGRLSDTVNKISNEDKDIIFLGRVPHDELGNYYALSDIVIIPSIVPEGHPVVAEEAMSLGKTIMGFDIGGLKKIFEEYPNSVGIKEMNSKSLSKAISEFIEKRCSHN